MIRHHPDDDLLLSLAAGRLPAGPGLLVRVHVERCVECARRMRVLEAVGGVLLEDAPLEVLAPTAIGRVYERIAATAEASAREAGMTRSESSRVDAPALPNAQPWPSAMRGCSVSRWRWMAPGMRWARVRLPQDPAASLFALRIAPGMSLARHTHAGMEMTQVLCGAFEDGRGVFGAGDFDLADGDVHHQPAVRSGEECVCLAYEEQRLRFDGRLAAAIGAWVGI